LERLLLRSRRKYVCIIERHASYFLLYITPMVSLLPTSPPSRSRLMKPPSPTWVLFAIRLPRNTSSSQPLTPDEKTLRKTVQSIDLTSRINVISMIQDQILLDTRQFPKNASTAAIPFARPREPRVLIGPWVMASKKSHNLHSSMVDSPWIALIAAQVLASVSFVIGTMVSWTSKSVLHELADMYDSICFKRIFSTMVCQRSAHAILILYSMESCPLTKLIYS
jgi:hypothetical protein